MPPPGGGGGDAGSKVIVDPQAQTAINNVRSAMDRLWQAFDDIDINGNQLADPNIWTTTVSAEYQTKWHALAPILTNAKKSSSDLNGHLVEYTNNINKELADSADRGV